MNKPIIRCVIWCRVSSEFQKLHGDSLENQEIRGLEKAYDLGYSRKDIKIYSVDESAKEAGDEFKKMIKACLGKRSNIEAVVVNKPSRFSRFLSDGAAAIEKLFKKEIVVYAIRPEISTIDRRGMLNFAKYIIQANEDNLERAENTIESNKLKILSGVYPGRPPRGYTKVNNKVVVSEDAPLIRRGFKLFIKGYSQTDIAHKIKEEFKVDTCSKRWSEWFSKPIYCGYINGKSLDYKLYQGNHEPIISKREWDEVQDILSGKRKPRKNVQEHQDKLPLKTFIKCPTCQNNITGSIAKNKNGKPGYYRCTRKGCSQNYRDRLVNNAFVSALNNIHFTDKLVGLLQLHFPKLYNDAYNYELKRKDVLKRKINSLELKFKKQMELFENDLINIEDFKLKKGEIEEQKTQTYNQISKISIPSIEDLKSRLLRMISKLGNTWNDINLSYKIQLQKILLDTLVYDKATGEINIELNSSFKN